MIIDGELLPSWVTYNTLVKVRHRILAAHGETGGLGELDPKKAQMWVGMQGFAAEHWAVVSSEQIRVPFQTDDDVPKQTNWFVKDLSRRGM